MIKIKAGYSVIGDDSIRHLGAHYLRSVNKGKTWIVPVQLGDVATGEDRRAIAVWDICAEDGLSIFYAESKDSGLTGSEYKPLSKSGMRATHPRIVHNESGFLTLWTERATGKA